MRLLVIFLVVAVVAILAFASCREDYDDGLWPLSVTVRSSAGQPIKAVSAEACMDVRSAKEMMSRLLPPYATRADHSIYAAVQEPKVDEPLKVNVPTSRRGFGRYNQYRGLLVVVEYEDGKLEGRVFEIPDLRQTREMTVEVP